MLLLREVWYAVLRYWRKSVLRTKWLGRVATEPGTSELRLHLLLQRLLLLLHLKWVRALGVLWHEGLLLLGEAHIVCSLLRHLERRLLEAWLLKCLIEACLLHILLLHRGLSRHRLLVIFQ